MSGLDMSDLSVVMSLTVDSAERVANLGRLLGFFDAVGMCPEVIVVAQPPVPSLTDHPALRLHVVADHGLHWKTRNIGASLSARPLLRFCESGTTQYKYPLNRKNVAYRLLEDGPTKEALAHFIAEAGRPAVFVLLLTTDAERQLRIAKAKLGKVEHGLPVVQASPSADQAFADVG